MRKMRYTRMLRYLGNVGHTRNKIILENFKDKGCAITESFLEKAGFTKANLREDCNNIETVIRHIEGSKGGFIGPSETYIREIIQEDGSSKYESYYRVGPELKHPSEYKK